MDSTTTIYTILEQSFQPEFLEIIDESYKHMGHEGAKDGGGHFVVHIVSTLFSGKNRMVRHRLINNATRHLFTDKTIHALSIHAKAPEEVV